MSETNKIQAAEWYKAIDTNYIYGVEEAAISTDGDDIIFTVKRSIPFEQMFDLANDVAAICVMDGVWHRDVFDVMFDYHILTYFTNLDCDVGIDQVYELIHHTNVMEDVKRVIVGQYTILYEMAVAACESAEKKADSEVRVLAGRINKFLDILNEQIKNANGLDQEKIDELAEKLSGLVSEVSEASDHQESGGNIVEMKRGK